VVGVAGASWAFAAAGAVLGLGCSSIFRTVEAATNTPNNQRMLAIRWRPKYGFASNTSQIISAISRGVFLGLAFFLLRSPRLPSSAAWSQR
jgi:hypothetical protein